jgi:hypothetical protein
MDSPKEISD